MIGQLRGSSIRPSFKTPEIHPQALCHAIAVTPVALDVVVHTVSQQISAIFKMSRVCCATPPTPSKKTLSHLSCPPLSLSALQVPWASRVDFQAKRIAPHGMSHYTVPLSTQEFLFSRPLVADMTSLESCLCCGSKGADLRALSLYMLCCSNAAHNGDTCAIWRESDETLLPQLLSMLQVSQSCSLAKRGII